MSEKPKQDKPKVDKQILEAAIATKDKQVKTNSIIRK